MRSFLSGTSEQKGFELEQMLTGSMDAEPSKIAVATGAKSVGSGRQRPWKFRRAKRFENGCYAAANFPSQSVLVRLQRSAIFRRTRQTTR